MEAMDRVHVVPEVRKRDRSVPAFSRAWLLDPAVFHDQFDELYAGIETSEGLARMRWLATQTWRSTDESVRGYVDLLRTGAADEWEADFAESQLADWYRVLMASHLAPLPAVSSPKVLRERLPELGWSASEARRLARGRELQSLVEAYGSLPVVVQIAPLLTIDSRGWLSQDDVDRALCRLHGLDRGLFRDAQDLVPLVEELYALLAEARAHPDRVVLLLSE